MTSPFAQMIPEEESTGLAIPEITSVPEFFKPGGTQEFLRSVAKHCADQKLSIDTSEGRDAIRTLAHQVTKTKTAMEKIFDKWAGEHRSVLKVASTEFDHFAKEMKKISERTRKPLTDFENYDADRVGAHETALAQAFDACLFVGTPSIAAIQARMDQLRILESRKWEEYGSQANKALSQATMALIAMLREAEAAEADRIQIEADRAELVRLRAERAATAPLPRYEPTEVTPQAFTAVSMMPLHAETPEQQAADHLTGQSVDDQILDALATICDLDYDQAADVLNAIKAGRIPHVQIIQ